MGWKDTIKEDSSDNKDSKTSSWRDTIQDAPGRTLGLGERLDSVTGAPSRALVGSLQKGNGLLDSLKQFGSNFGGDPANAPSATDIRKGFGIPDASLKDVLNNSTGPMRVAGLLMKALNPSADEANSKLDVGDLLTGAATDYSNALPLAKGVELAGTAAKSLKLPELLAQGAGLVGKGLENSTFLKAGLGAAGAHAHGLGGYAVSQLLEPVVAKGIQGAKSIGSRGIEALKDALENARSSTELTSGPFKNFPASPTAPLLTQVTRDPGYSKLTASLLREKMAEDRAQK